MDEFSLVVAEILADEAAHPSPWPKDGEGERDSPQSPAAGEVEAYEPPRIAPLSPIGRSPAVSVSCTDEAISLKADEDEAWLFPSPQRCGKDTVGGDKVPSEAIGGDIADKGNNVVGENRIRYF